MITFELPYERVNFKHPDKIADRIAGAIVDLCYKKSNNPKAAVEVLVGHGICNIIIEASEQINKTEIEVIVARIDSDIKQVNLLVVPQDKHLAENQSTEIRCGDNGLCLGLPLTAGQIELSKVVKLFEDTYSSDGKYILNKQNNTLIICQSNATTESIKNLLKDYGYNLIVNPLGDWTGGINVDSGATNRKLGSDMGGAVTGGGLVGKDISKADVSMNIYCFLLAQKYNNKFHGCYAIGDKNVVINGKQVAYKTAADIAKKYIDAVGGFEAFSADGLIGSFCNNIDSTAIKDILQEL